MCHVTFPATKEYFGSDKKGKQGLSSRCKTCLRKLRESKKEIKRQYDKKRREELGEKWVNQAKEYYRNNKEKKSEYDRKYRIENRDSRNEQKRKYYLKNRDYYLKKNKEHVMQNKEHYLKYRMNYYQLNKDEIKRKNNIWRTSNPDKFNTLSQRRRARKKSVESNYTHEEWESCKKFFHNKCAYCGTEEKLTQEHFIPLSKGGEYTINNIIPACKSCNCSKQDKDFFDWYKLTDFYSPKREQKILRYLNYKNNKQQLALF